MIKVNKKMLDEFLDLMEDLGEFVFGSKKYLKQQLETCLNVQGYWSGNYVRAFYNDKTKKFYAKSKY